MKEQIQYKSIRWIIILIVILILICIMILTVRGQSQLIPNTEQPELIEVLNEIIQIEPESRKIENWISALDIVISIIDSNLLKTFLIQLKYFIVEFSKKSPLMLSPTPPFLIFLNSYISVENTFSVGLNFLSVFKNSFFIIGGGAGLIFIDNNKVDFALNLLIGFKI